MLSAALLAGCGQETEPASDIRQADDPAMQAPQSMPVDGASGRAVNPLSSAADDNAFRADPDTSVVDLDARRVYLPGTGWVSGDAFLDLYLNRPADLPDDIDLHAVHELASLLMSQES